MLLSLPLLVIFHPSRSAPICAPMNKSSESVQLPQLKPEDAGMTSHGGVERSSCVMLQHLCVVLIQLVEFAYLCHANKCIQHIVKHRRFLRRNNNGSPWHVRRSNSFTLKNRMVSLKLCLIFQ